MAILQIERRTTTIDYSQWKAPTIASISIQETRVTVRSNLREQLDHVQRLQNQWDSALGRRRRPGEFMNYNPVLARWNAELMQTADAQEIFRATELQNIKTALRERNKSATSELTLSIDSDGKIRESHHAEEPWEDVLERGRAHRAENGSKEIEREQAELIGFQKIQAGLTDKETPVGTTYMVVSPPGLVEDTPYPDNYVDFYQLAEHPDTKEKYIKYIRFSSPFDYARYKKVVEQIDPHYFDGQSEYQGPIDSWYLQRPIRFDVEHGYTDAHDIFAKHLEKDAKSMEEETFQSLWRIYLPAALHYLDVLTQPIFDPIEVAKAWNTVLLSPENKNLRKIAEEMTVFISPNATRLNTRGRRVMGAMVNTYGYDKPKTVKGGCGSSEGVDIKDNSVGKFGGVKVSKGGEDNYGAREFDCPECGGTNNRPENELISACQKCGSSKVAC